MADEPVAKDRTWTEAPASWNIRYRINGFDEQITLRGDSYAEIAQMVDKARDYVKHIISAHGAINTEPPAPQPPAPTGNGQHAANGGTFNIVKLTVTPRQDGKVDLNFFEAGHQYSDIKAVKTPADAAILLQPTGGWTPEHFGKAADYQVKMLIDWKPSDKLNSKGNPYKNIAAVRAA